MSSNGEDHPNSLKIEAQQALDILYQQMMFQKSIVLTDLQVEIFRQSWSGCTYSQIAKACYRDEQTIKDCGYELWKLISETLDLPSGIRVNKKNLREILRQSLLSKSVSKTQEVVSITSSLEELAKPMRTWFETLGYRFEQYESQEERAFEWIIDIPTRRGCDRILVRGVLGEVSIAELTKIRQSVEQQGTNEGWLVTARRIGPAVRASIEQDECQRFYCYTFDELLDQAADFTHYLAWLEEQIKQQEIDTKYVPLACIKEEFDLSGNQVSQVNYYGEREGWIEGCIDRWLDDPAKEHISVLGEFGTGKTWFVLHYAWVALQRYQEAKQRGTVRPRLPIVIPLRDYAKAVSVESLFSEFFFRKHEIPLPGYSAFEQLNRMGKLLLIFDGFDEMAARVDRQQMINNFWELAKVVVPGSKIVLTCRTEHFPEAREGRNLLNAELKASISYATGESPQFEVLELEKFNDEQIHQVLQLNASEETVQKVMENSDLLDLARRPVMTDLILEALPDIEAGKLLDMSRIYLYAVTRKIERDIKAERTFTSLADKLYFLCELSWEMLSTEQMSLNYRLFPDRIRQLFRDEVQNEKELDHWHYDMMGQTMLIRNASGDYSPAHRSLLEFFVAYKFASELGLLAPDFLQMLQQHSSINRDITPQEYTWVSYFQRKRQDDGATKGAPHLEKFIGSDLFTLRKSVGKLPLSRAIVDLMIPMLDNSSSLLTMLAKFKNLSKEEIGFLGSNIVNLLLRIDRTILENQDLSHTVLNQVDFTNASLQRTNFSGADLNGSRFIKVLGVIVSLSFSPDGNQLLVGDSQGRLYLLQKVSNWKSIFSCKGHTDWVWATSFSPCGSFFASVNDCLKIWNSRTGECLRTIETGHPLLSVVFHPERQLIFVGADSGYVQWWDTNTGECLVSLQVHVGRVWAVAVHPEGKLFASGGEDGLCKIWKIENNFSNPILLKVLEGHSSIVRSLSFSPDGTMLTSGSEDHEIRLWNAATGVHLKTLLGHKNRVCGVVFTPDSRRVISGSADGTIRVWSLHEKQYVTLQGHPGCVRKVAISPDGQVIVSGGDRSTLKFWDINNEKCLNTIQGYTNSVYAVAWSPCNCYVASGGEDGSMRLWDVEKGECIQVFSEEGQVNRLLSITFSPDGKTLASGYENDVAKLWHINGQCLQMLKSHRNRVRSLSYSSDSRIIATASEDWSVKLWDTHTGQCLKTFQGETQWVWSVSIINSYSEDNDYLFVTGGDDGGVRLWTMVSDIPAKLLGEHQGSVHSVACSPTGFLVASGGQDGTARLWNIQTGECLRVLQDKKSSGWIWSVDFNYNGQLLASGSSDLMIRLWEVSTGECVRVLEGHSALVRSVKFSPNGQFLASGSVDETVKIWDIKTGICLNTLKAASPYEGMNITNVQGLTDGERSELLALGAILSDSTP